ncbi:MAG: hypothetical protein HOP28_04455 [Gemmatimonadales bacterium]|nr:hypothetical protein [Gemmatimonadales bacterium]
MTRFPAAPQLRRAACLLSGLVLALGCSAPDPVSPAPPAPPVADQVAAIARGHTAFESSCASCHASRDGFDLAFFGFGKSNIVRRAVRHVPQSTAEDIAAYIASLGVASRGRSFRIFQPRGGVA